MIESLRGSTVLLVEISPELREVFRVEFEACGALCIEANLDDLDALLERLFSEGRRIDVLIAGPHSEPCSGAGSQGFDPEAIGRAAAGAAAPIFSAMKAVRAVFAQVPRYHIVLSALAPERFSPGAELRAAGEAALETLSRYAHQRLRMENSRMNVLRYRLADRERGGASCKDVAHTALAICSGWMDSMGGQVVTVDRGVGFRDNAFRDCSGSAEANP